MILFDAFAQPFLALLMERFVGYPPQLFNSIGHPVQWMGRFITVLDEKLNTTPHVKNLGRVNGLLALFLLIFGVWCVAAIIHVICAAIPYGFILNALVATTLIAQKSMRDHVSAVMRALGSSLGEGRAAVGKIVGRDTRNLDVSGVVKAALESLAENTADGIVAPIFWYAIFGLPGLAVYKAINTADSMIGHKSFQYLHFGWASARADDLANFIPARLTTLLFAAAAWFKSKAMAKQALTVAWRDAAKHRSPNAGWPEAAMAGAMGLRFGGPRSYGEDELILATMGDGRDHFLRSDIDNGLKLYDRALNVLLGLAAVWMLVF